MDNYTLYLDESTTHSGNYKDDVLCMAGIIIKDDDYSIIENDLNHLKRVLWSDVTNPNEIVLHQMQLNQATKHKNYKNKKIEPSYERFKINSKCRQLYELLGGIFDKNSIYVIGATLDMQMLKTYFNYGNKPDPYLITLQLIMENYCHFLCNNSSRGKIIYESIDNIVNQRLQDRFFHVKLMGSMYISKETMEKHLMSMEFIRKEKNNAGLQLADFVPNYFARTYNNFKLHRFNIDKQLRLYRYDGNLNLRDRFGVKNMP